MAAIHGRYSRSQAIIQNGECVILLVSCASSSPVTRHPLFFSFIGSEIDCEDENGNSPLHIAARYGHELLINTLMTNGADTAK